MIDYKEYEKSVYNWLSNKNKQDPDFTFSLRQNEKKGAELDYFMGGEKSRYLTTTFWNIPTNNKGSLSNCISLVFMYSADNLKYNYDFLLRQTNSPQNEQNSSVLNIIKSLVDPLNESIGVSRKGNLEIANLEIRTRPKKRRYTNLDEMLEDINEDLLKIIPLVNKQIEEEKKVNPEFVAHRITKKEFAEMQAKLQTRFTKYAHLKNSANKNITNENIAPNYWIFQGNPDIYNITNALKAAHLKSWKVAAHKDNIKIGDKVIIWQTGKNAGCYALAEVTSEVSVFEEEAHEQWYYTNKSDGSATERVKINIEHYLAETPILWKDIKDLLIFENFNARNQGTNFVATKEEYEELKNLIDDGNTFEKTKSKLDHTIFEEYIAFVRSLIQLFKLNPNDPRVVYSVRGYSLNFIIGQKYCVNVFTSKNKENFGVISTQKLSNKNEKFSGKATKTYYNYLNELVLDENKKNTVVEAIESLLQKTTKSGYSKYNNTEFENYVFGIASNKEINMNFPLNQILYGPPGTGKTFYLKDQLFNKYTSKQTSISKEQHFESVVSNCTWWQVIAIALLELGNSKVSEIHENNWVKKKESLSNSKSIRPTLWGQLQSHTIDDCEYVKFTNRQTPQLFTKTEDSYWEILEEQVQELAPELYDIKDSVDNYNPDPDKIIKHYDFVTFHQSFSYEDFIEGIKPVFPEDGEEAKELGYKIENGIFKNMCIKAQNDPENTYAIFIDEINRGNVSAIFGELITLIETDKRKGAKNEMSITLPYSKKEFSVPINIDIYGTMNTADRSVEALDTALRRRFKFKEMMPDYEVIKNIEIEGFQLSEVLKVINERIELLVDRYHTIGHSYFINVNSKEALANAFNDKIVPLLQEYFYGDYGKIGLVLGKGFVETTKNPTTKFANFEYDNAADFITESHTLLPQNENTIIDSIKLLLNKTEV